MRTEISLEPFVFDGIGDIAGPGQTAEVARFLKSLVYQIILRKFYSVEIFVPAGMICSETDAGSGLPRYYRLTADHRAVTINNTAGLPALDLVATTRYTRYVSGGEVTKELEQDLPLSGFEAEGLSILRLEECTREHAIDMIKNALMIYPDDEKRLLVSARRALQVLGGNKAVEYGLVPFVGSEEKARNPVVYGRGSGERNSFSILPVFAGEKPVGIVEMYSGLTTVDYAGITARIEMALPVIARVLENRVRQINADITGVIRDSFTAIQPAVQWKFEDVAVEYLAKRYAGRKDMEIGEVTFDAVYPFYGMVDIRNSTDERNQAFARDVDNLLDLLETAETTISGQIDAEDKLQVGLIFGQWYKEIGRIQRAGESGLLPYFLQSVAVPFLDTLLTRYPAAEEAIVRLREVLLRNGPEVTAHRDLLESSMRKISAALNGLFHGQRETLSAIFPNYFETIRTDGIEYDLYVGQSISPDRHFLPKHLEAFRKWQMRSMIEAAAVAKRALDPGDWPLVTTQLIFINGHPIDINFRSDERHFDVEGSYNIRYQLIKKRIDKVHLKDTGERLTQPGKIAIVYRHDSDLAPYLEHIRVLEGEGLISGATEFFELEDLQGVYDLKAIRVALP